MMIRKVGAAVFAATLSAFVFVETAYADTATYMQGARDLMEDARAIQAETLKFTNWVDAQDQATIDAAVSALPEGVAAAAIEAGTELALTSNDRALGPDEVVGLTFYYLLDTQGDASSSAGRMKDEWTTWDYLNFVQKYIRTIVACSVGSLGCVTGQLSLAHNEIAQFFNARANEALLLESRTQARTGTFIINAFVAAGGPQQQCWSVPGDPRYLCCTFSPFGSSCECAGCEREALATKDPDVLAA